MKLAQIKKNSLIILSKFTIYLNI